MLYLNALQREVLDMLLYDLVALSFSTTTPADIDGHPSRCAGWYKADLPFQGQYDLENVGRTPNVVSGED